MAAFLLKTEPGTYSFDDLARDGATRWDGVSNPAALKHIRSAARGDTLFIYHTGDEKAIVGTATVASAPYEDPANPGKTAAGEPKTPVLDIEAGKPAKTPLTLAAMKTDARFAADGFELLRQPRLSVMPVPPAVERAIRDATGL